MDTPNSEAIAAFFATHEAALVALTLAVQQEAGGYYATLPLAEQQALAANSVRYLAEAVVSGRVGHAGIAAMVATRPDPSLIATIVCSAELQEPRFAQFVAETLPDNPALAAEIQRRARNVSARFRVALASANMSQLAERTRSEGPPAPRPRPRPDDPPR